MQNARLYEAQAGIKIFGRNINNLRYVDDTTFMLQSEEGLKSLLTKVKEETQQRRIRAASATYTTAHGNAGSLTH